MAKAIAPEVACGTPEHASLLCRELAEGTNGNVPIQSAFEKMLILIGREDVITDMRTDASNCYEELFED